MLRDKWHSVWPWVLFSLIAAAIPVVSGYMGYKMASPDPQMITAKTKVGNVSDYFEWKDKDTQVVYESGKDTGPYYKTSCTQVGTYTPTTKLTEVWQLTFCKREKITRKEFIAQISDEPVA